MAKEKFPKTRRSQTSQSIVTQVARSVQADVPERQPLKNDTEWSEGGRKDPSDVSGASKTNSEDVLEGCHAEDVNVVDSPKPDVAIDQRDSVQHDSSCEEKQSSKANAADFKTFSNDVHIFDKSGKTDGVSDTIVPIAGEVRRPESNGLTAGAIHPECDHQGDEPQQLYSNLETIWTLFCIVTYVIDVGSDVYVAVMYYMEKEWWWFSLTVSFIVIPSLTISIFSCVWYKHDKEASKPVRFIPRIIFVILQLGPIIRYNQDMLSS